MTPQEIKICNKKKYPVQVVGSVDSFGYFTPKEDAVYIIQNVTEWYDGILQEFRRSVSLCDPSFPKHSFTVSANSVRIAAGMERTLEEDVAALLMQRIDKTLEQAAASGLNQDDILKLIEKHYQRKDDDEQRSA